MTEKDLGRKHLPMSETAYCILLSLCGEQHGYGVMQQVEQMTGGRIRLGAGTLYGTLQKLERDKLIEGTREEDRRKYYRVTERGRVLLGLELSRLEELAGHGRTIMGEKV